MDKRIDFVYNKIMQIQLFKVLCFIVVVHITCQKDC
jgi:hypothetical protein